MKIKNRIGEEKLNNKGVKMKIIKYINNINIDVEFENGYIKKNVQYRYFKNGSIDHIDYSKRIGETRTNNFGSKAIVVDYVNSNNVYIEFENNYKMKCTWQSFDKGSFVSPYCKTVFSVGYLGEGKYSISDKWYTHWNGFIQRVHYKKHKSAEHYKNVLICEDWYNYQTFAKWAEENYYEIPNHQIQLDKDILIKGNKLYSPDTCVFVPQVINALFTKSDKARGDLPIGVYWFEEGGNYRAQCSYVDDNNVKRNKWLGGYDNPEDAFYAYKTYKEEYIKKVADKFKKYIPEKLYNALYNYEVEITD